MKRSIALISFCLLLGITLYSYNAKVAVSEKDAKTLAGEALARYCEMEKLSPQHFMLKEIGPVGDFPWMLVYVSSGITPAHEVVVTINKHGGLEVSMDIQP